MSTSAPGARNANRTVGQTRGAGDSRRSIAFGAARLRLMERAAGRRGDHGRVVRVPGGAFQAHIQHAACNMYHVRPTACNVHYAAPRAPAEPFRHRGRHAQRPSCSMAAFERRQVRKPSARLERSTTAGHWPRAITVAPCVCGSLHFAAGAVAYTTCRAGLCRGGCPWVLRPWETYLAAW